MRAAIQGGFHPIVEFSVAIRAAGRMFVRIARKATPHHRDPFLYFLDAYDRFLGHEIDDVQGDRC